MTRAAIDKLRRDAARDTRRVHRRLPIRIDAITGALQRPDGSWEFDGVATRGDGVFDYSADAGKPWREYRSVAEVGAANSIDSLVGAEITDDHPDDFVDTVNARELGRGTVMRAWMDGPLMRVRVIVRDAELLAKIFAGKVELSCGYTAIVLDTPGVHPTEGPYEGVQTAIIHNHLAVVDVARAGPVARLAVPPMPAGAGAGVDQRDAAGQKKRDMNEIVINGATLQIDPTGTTVPQVMVEAYNQQQEAMVALQTENAALKAELAALKAAAAAPAPDPNAPPLTPPAPPAAPAATPPVVEPPGDAKGDKNKNKDTTTMTDTKGTGLTEAQVKSMLDARDIENARKADKARVDAAASATRSRIIADAAPHLGKAYDFTKKSDAEILADAVIALDKDAEGYARQLAAAKSVDGLTVLLQTKVDARNGDVHRAVGQVLAQAAAGSKRDGNANTARQAMHDRKMGRKPAAAIGAGKEGN